GAYVNNEKVELYAICDLNEQRAKDKAEKYGAKKVYVDYNDLMNDPEVDAVSICTWNNTHAEIATAAVNSGKHVLVEKPMTTSVEKALKLEEAVKNSGKQLQVGFVRRYASNTQVLKKFIENDDLGEI